MPVELNAIVDFVGPVRNPLCSQSRGLSHVVSVTWSQSRGLSHVVSVTWSQSRGLSHVVSVKWSQCELISVPRSSL